MRTALMILAVLVGTLDPPVAAGTVYRLAARLSTALFEWATFGGERLRTLDPS